MLARWRSAPVARRLAVPALATFALLAIALPLLSLAVPAGDEAATAPRPPASDEPAPAGLRARAVEPVAGGPGVPAELPAEALGAEAPVPESGRGQSASVSPGAPSDAAVRAEVEALEREQAKVTRILLGVSSPVRGGSGRFVLPVAGPVTSPFCQRRSWERCHPGVDIAAPTGTAIRAADSGQVVLAGPQGGYGNFTCIAHARTLFTCYAHQSQVLVRAGEVVDRGQVIGAVGSTGFSTGPHLHFEVRSGGRLMDPLSFL